MTDKVLPGVSREAWSFMTQHWKSLAKMSAIPFALYMAFTVFQMKSLGDLYRSMGNMMTDPNFMGSYMRSMAFSMLASIASFCLLGTLFAQIIRFHKTGEANWLMTSKAGIGAGLMTLVYGIGISLLTMLVYIGGVIVFAIVFGILAAVLGGGTAGAVIVGGLGFAGIVGLIAGLYWFMFRFIAGLPGVALGHSPDFFKDMWPLAKGESWGLPLRMVLATLVAYVPMLLIMFIFGGAAFSDFITAVTQQGGNSDPAAIFPVMADMMDRMIPVSVLTLLAFMPFMWFMTLLLGIAFQRFRARG